MVTKDIQIRSTWFNWETLQEQKIISPILVDSSLIHTHFKDVVQGFIFHKFLGTKHGAIKRLIAVVRIYFLTKKWKLILFISAII